MQLELPASVVSGVRSKIEGGPKGFKKFKTKISMQMDTR